MSVYLGRKGGGGEGGGGRGGGGGHGEDTKIGREIKSGEKLITTGRMGEGLQGDKAEGEHWERTKERGMEGKGGEEAESYKPGSTSILVI